MVNNSKRFLSLLLALVMVIALMPVGYANAAVSTEGNTINMEVNDKYTFKNVSGDVDTSNLGSVAEIEEEFVQNTVYAAKIVDLDEIVSGNKYVIANSKSEKELPEFAILTGTKTDTNFLSLSGNVNSVNAETFCWTIEIDGTSYYAYCEDAEGNKNYLTIGDSSAGTVPESEKPALLLSRKYGVTNDLPEGDTYTISIGMAVNGTNQYLNAHGGTANKRAGGYYQKADDGAGWHFYEIKEIPEFTYTKGESVPSVSEGKFVLANRNGGKYLSSTHTDGKLYNNGGTFERVGSPLMLKADVVDLTTVWSVTKNGDNYYVQDVHNRYLYVANDRALMSTDPSDVTLEEVGSSWAIKANSAYLNNYGGANSFAAGWVTTNDSSKVGNQWTAYSVTATAVGTTNVIVTAKEGGSGTITIGGITYTINVTEPAVEEPKVTVNGFDVELSGEIALGYPLQIPQDQDVSVRLTKGDTQVNYNAEQLAANQGLVKMPIASTEMNVDVKIEAFGADDQPIKLLVNGQEKDSVSLSVVDFAKSVIVKNEDAGKVQLAKALLTYGGYAQQLFKFDPENPAYDKVEGAKLSLDNVTVDNVAGNKITQTNRAEGLKAISVDAELQSYLCHRVYLDVNTENAEGYTVTMNGGNLAIEKNDKGYYVEIPEITSKNISDNYTITVTSASGTNEITSSVLAYVRLVLNNENNSVEKTNMAKALFLYSQAADAFFGN